MKTLKFFSTMLILLAMCMPMISCSDDDDDAPASNASIEGYWTDYDEMWYFEDGACAASEINGTWSAYGTYGNGNISVSDSEGKRYTLLYSMPDNNTLVLKLSDGQPWGTYSRYNPEK